MSAVDVGATTREHAHATTAARAALADVAPFAVAVIPFGLAVGTAGSAAGLSFPELMFGAVAMLAGAAQLAAIQAIGRGESLLVVATVVALVNLRFVIYGAGIANWFRQLPLRRRLALAFPVVDQTFLLCQHRFDDGVDLAWRQRYYLVATALLGGAFVASQAVAYRLGAGVPSEIGLHLAAPLTFTGMFARAVGGRRELVAGALAAAIVIVASGPVGPAALPLGVLLGAGAATMGRRES